MEKFQGKVAVVTGASAGIGAAIAKALVEDGMTVVGLARRKEKIEALAESLNGAKGKLHAVKTDIRNEEEILEAFRWTTKNVGPVHVLVNNAGIIVKGELVDGETSLWKSLFDVNVIGLTVASREAIKIMRDNDIDGHVVNINSVAGHKVVDMPGYNVYNGSKYAVTALTETLRLELIRLGSKIKVTSLSPGLVDTPIIEINGMTTEMVCELYDVEKLLGSEDLAEAVRYIISTPPHVQVTELIMRPVGQML